MIWAYVARLEVGMLPTVPRMGWLKTMSPRGPVQAAGSSPFAAARIAKTSSNVTEITALGLRPLK